MPVLKRKKCISCEAVKPREDFATRRTCHACAALAAKRAAQVAVRRLARQGQPVRWSGECV